MCQACARHWGHSSQQSQIWVPPLMEKAPHKKALINKCKTAAVMRQGPT